LVAVLRAVRDQAKLKAHPIIRIVDLKRSPICSPVA
jgi:hypothetical protein